MAKLIERGWMPLGVIARWPRNPKDHDVPGLLASMRRHGFVGACIIDQISGRLVAGHGRLDALTDMKKAGQPAPENIDIDPESGDWQIPVDVYEFPSEAEAEAFLMTDNQTTIGPGWNRELLGEMVERHLAAGGQAALHGSGFSQEFLRDLMAERNRRERYREARDAVVDRDHMVELQAKWSTELGQVWSIPSRAADGNHLLACGDSTDPDVLALVLGRRLVDLIVCDPPYNVDWHSTSAKLDKMWGGIENDYLDEEAFVVLLLDTAHLVTQVLRPGGSYYICMGVDEFTNLKYQMRRLGLDGRPIIWGKPSIGPGLNEYRPTYEMILFGYHGDRSERTWNGGRNESNLWKFTSGRGVIARRHGDGMIISVGLGPESLEIELPGVQAEGLVRFHPGEHADLWELSRARGAYLHPTQKPIELYERAIRNSSHPGDLVLDMFAGSGTCFVAAERLGRLAAGVDLSPAYVAVILERLAELGLAPVNVSAETQGAGEESENREDGGEAGATEATSGATKATKPKKSKAGATKSNKSKAGEGGDK